MFLGVTMPTTVSQVSDLRKYVASSDNMNWN